LIYFFIIQLIKFRIITIYTFFPLYLQVLEYHTLLLLSPQIFHKIRKKLALIFCVIPQW